MFASKRSDLRRAAGDPRRSDEIAASPPTERGNARTTGRPPLPPLIPAFDVRSAEREGVRVVEVEGEIDILTAPALAAALSDDGARADALVLDLAKVPFVSSPGLRLIVSAHRRLSQRRGLALAGLHANVAHVLEIVGLADELLVAADVPAAIRLLADRHD
jgi:anti-sigma B factor antagonist